LGNEDINAVSEADAERIVILIFGVWCKICLFHIL